MPSPLVPLTHLTPPAYPLPPRYFKQVASLTPPPPTIGTYEMFGSIFQQPDTIPALSSLSQTQLYPDETLLPNSDPSIKQELTKLNHTLLITFARLVKTMAVAPLESEVKIEEIRVLLVNIHHLINTLRPIQARQGLESMMKEQIRRKRDAAEEMRKYGILWFTLGAV
jgi:mediator of RNA polymerase II transcription subunit 7